jgi:hypothetical protein
MAGFDGPQGAHAAGDEQTQSRETRGSHGVPAAKEKREQTKEKERSCGMRLLRCGGGLDWIALLLKNQNVTGHSCSYLTKTVFMAPDEDCS